MNNDLDSKYALKAHRSVVRKNKFLNLIYRDFYNRIKSQILLRPIVEIGSGAGFIKNVIQDAITTDVIKGQDIDKIVFAEKLPFKSNSVGSIVMLNVFHHIKDPVKALSEFNRCLKPSGRVIMIEPWPTLWSKFIYQNLHHEDFDVNRSWKIKGRGRMSDANGALPWIIFKRDAIKFKKLFPNLNILKIEPHTPVKYLISGGLSKPQLLSTKFYKLVDNIEKLLSPFNILTAMFATIVITKASIRTKRG